jgi:DNA replication protein DnaC
MLEENDKCCRRPDAATQRALHDGTSRGGTRAVFDHSAGASGNTPSTIRNYRHYVVGSTGVGKSWIGCALAQKACRDGFSVLHKKTSELFRELAIANVDGSIGRLLVRLAQIDVLLLDDFAMAPLKDSERRDFLEVCDDRYQRRSLILTSQLPISHWHEQIGDPTLADSILDRILHNAYRIELKGESLRKTLGGKPEPEDGQ